MEEIDYPILLEYFEGKASLKQKRQVSKWKKDLQLNEQIEQAFLIWEMTNFDNQHKVNIDVALEKVKKNILEWKYRKKKNKFLRTRWIAASIVLFFGLTGLFSYFYFSKPVQDLMFIVKSETTFSGLTKVGLSDGTLIWLNKESYIEIINEKDRRNRKVKLIGEGYFEVNHNDNLPFIVQTSINADIKVLGTKFDVKSSIHNKNILSVTLVEGKVNLLVNENGETKEYPLIQGSRVIYNKDKKKLNFEQVNTNAITSWTRKNIVLKNVLLEEVITDLEKWYNVKINVEEKLKKKYYTTLTIRDESLEKSLKIISQILPIQYRIGEREIFITKK